MVLNGAGKELLCQAEEVRSDSTSLSVIQENNIPPLPFEITLYQAVTKGKTMDLIIQKATELGAHRVVPVLSERSVPDWDEAKAAAKVDKWRSVCVESIKQCGSAWLPKLEMPMKPSAAIADARGAEIALIATLQPTRNIPERYRRLRSRKRPSAKNWPSGLARKATTPRQGSIRYVARPTHHTWPARPPQRDRRHLHLAFLNYELQSRP